MYRRRRPSREIQFSFDSFLDVVANVCGIIIRLILVAWVGARSYHAVAAHKALEEMEAAPPTVVATAPAATGELMVITDPLQQQLQRQRQELEQEQQRLLEQLRQHQQLGDMTSRAEGQLVSLTATEAALAAQREQAEKTVKDQAGAAQSTWLSISELKQRSDRLAAELRELEKLPPATKTIHYRTPVSRPVHTEELHFECREGRISYIDLDAFLVEIRAGFEDNAKTLQNQWSVSGTTGQVGPFRLRYTVERDRGPLDASLSTGFHYRLAGWVVEPMTALRGETAAAALVPGSEFRRVADALDPEQSVVTMWVYPDSFAIYRQLRDYLHEHNIEVAGRAIPQGVAIASSKQGTASRGQ
jgi:hypothetical protein